MRRRRRQGDYMTMWLIILVVVLALMALSVITLIRKFRKFNKKINFLWGTLIVFLLFALFSVIWTVINSIIIMIHLCLFWVIIDLLGLLVRKVTKKDNSTGKIYWEGIVAILATVIYFSVGWYLAHNVWITSYDVATDKDTGVESFRVVGFGDAHMGAIFDYDKLSEHVETINELNPDVVLIVGDFIDDATTKENMEKSCDALSKLNARYGVYFSYGNHDAGYYSAEKRGYSREDFEKKLIENNVTILVDEVCPVVGNIYLIGRNDTRVTDREKAQNLSAKVPEGAFSIVMDHEPNDYDNEENARMDLVLSGHTHGGQFFPITRVGELIGANDKTYGYEKRTNTNFVVTSGIADWEIKFKTGCKSEIFVVNIVKE